jgi:hypothetical protein
MAPILLACGQSRTEKRSLSLTKSDKDRILQNFPEKITVTVPGFGGQELPLRSCVKSFLDQVTPPMVKAAFVVRGDEKDPDSIDIEATGVKVLGPSGGSFKAVDVEVRWEFDADLEPGETTIEACVCEHGEDGWQKSRVFRFVWELEISLDPGTVGLYEVEEFEIAIAGPCICVEDHEPDDEPAHGDDQEAGAHEDEDRKGKKKSGKKKSRSRDR